MTNKLFAAAVAALALATGPALAQSSMSPSMSPLAPGASHSRPGPLTFHQMPQTGQLMASELMEANIYGADGATIGDIKDVVVDTSGQIQAVVFGVGGFLGVGEKNVAVPLTALQVSEVSGSSGIRPSGTGWNARNRITLNATKDQLKSAPDFRVQRPATTGWLVSPSGSGSMPR
ncbi:PRC-barrel domain-containing protein [Blastochloris sulfoviridis]|nr:PRC-barrel domain-containing protein [Blastochloris sulfoviridis]